MTDHKEQLNLSDDKLRAYLLGKLPAPEGLALDERLLSDDELAQRMRLAEAELIDDYAGHRLDQPERQFFISNFLVTAERKQAVEVSAELGRYARAHNSPAKAKHQHSLVGLFSLTSPRGWALAGSFALLLVVGLIWFVVTRRSEPRVIVQQQPAPAASPQPARSPATIAQAPQPSPPALEIKPTPEPAPPIAVANIVILPGALRSGGETARVAVPRGDRDVVRITLVLESSDPATYRAEVETADGQKVAVKERLQPHRNGQSKVTFDIPARLLQNGDYQVKLSQVGNGESQPAGRYYFRALQQ